MCSYKEYNRICFIIHLFIGLLPKSQPPELRGLYMNEDEKLPMRS